MAKTQRSTAGADRASRISVTRGGKKTDPTRTGHGERMPIRPAACGAQVLVLSVAATGTSARRADTPGSSRKINRLVLTPTERREQRQHAEGRWAEHERPPPADALA